ncbi:hypothetical protein PVAG01_05815 [Phlyctema vagabunda]|uniref:DUF7708 domain-containing protein n=1 Tax=Phlyctema vagabunda TaxID=108571 RepID=A0ABR4PEA8_9HELO
MRSKPELETDDTSMADGLEDFETALQKEFGRIWDEVRSNFTKDILKDFEHVDSHAKLEALIKKVQLSSDDHTHRHGKKWRGSSARLQKVCATLSRLLEGYVGIGEIIKSIHPCGGPLAYGTLSILLTICRNKEDREDMIAAGLEDVAQWLKITPSYQEIYHDVKTQDLTRLVVNVYTSIYRFVLDICKYATSKRVRCFRSLMPPKYDTRVTIDTMTAAVSAMGTETTLLLHKRVRNIQCDYKILRQMFDGMKQDFKDKDQAEWSDFLTEVQSHFQIHRPANHGFWESESGDGEFTSNSMAGDDIESNTRIEQGNLAALEERAEFVHWRNSPKSSGLILRAVNHRDASYHLPLWLSQAVYELSIKLRQDAKNRVIYHVVKTDLELHSAVGDIILQIMAWDLAFYRQYREIVKQSFRTQDRLSKRSLDLAKYLLTAWSKAREEEWVYVILSGIHQWTRPFQEGVPEDLELVMKTFHEMLTNGSAKIKICLLVDNSRWSTDIQTYMNLLDPSKRFIITTKWQQADAPY